MLLTITTTHSPATDIGFLLEKHPDKVHAFLACSPSRASRWIRGSRSQTQILI